MEVFTCLRCAVLLVYFIRFCLCQRQKGKALQILKNHLKRLEAKVNKIIFKEFVWFFIYNHLPNYAVSEALRFQLI